MNVIGLTGSISMGKSTVAGILVGEGIPVFDADAEVHALYDSAEGAALLAPLVPQAIVGHRVDRQRLSDHVHKHPEALDALEHIVHAEIARRRDVFETTMRKAGHKLIVFDIPLLFEKGNDRIVDVTIVVSAPAPVQRSRALARAGMTQARLDMILKRQMPDAEKRSRATYIIENDGSLQQLRDRTLAVLATIRSTMTDA